MRMGVYEYGILSSVLMENPQHLIHGTSFFAAGI